MFFFDKVPSKKYLSTIITIAIWRYTHFLDLKPPHMIVGYNRSQHTMAFSMFFFVGFNPSPHKIPSEITVPPSSIHIILMS